MDRRAFIVGAATGAAVLGSYAIAGACSDLLPPAGRRPRKHWAWLRGEVKALDDWRRSLATMKAAGIDAVLISGSAEFYRRAVPAAAAEGLELHAWIFTMMRGEHLEAHPDWYAVSRSGVSTAVKPPYVNYYRFMCPSREPVRQWLADYVAELSAIDGLASVHLDYIRYPDVILPVALWPKYNLVQDKEYPDFDFCYCAVCRDRFKRASGIDPQQLTDPPSHKAWVQYRCDTMTEVVNLIADRVHAQKKLVTVAVFPTPSIARRLVRQEWTKWRVDAVLPMVYHGFYKEEVSWVERATREGVKALAGRIPLYTGLYVPDLPQGEDLARAARFALAGGADGICLFQGNALTPEHWQALTPVLAQKAGA